MHFTSVALMAALSTVALSTPVEKRFGKQTLSVQQVSTGKKVKQAPAIVVNQPYLKFAKVGASAPSVVKSAALSAQTGTVAATPEADDESYLCPVIVGGQTLNLDFDTGSSDLWVYSTLMPSAQQSGHSIYNPNDSTSAIMSGQTWNIGYGDGSGAAGVVYADKVVIGAVTATKQAVEAATSVSSQFISDTASDGLLGLAMSNINTVSPNQQTTFFGTIMSSLAAPVFTAKLKMGQPGSYDFGFIDSSKYTGKLAYVPVNAGSGFWEFQAGGYKIGSGAKNATWMGTAIADTGTSLWYLPAWVAAKYWSKVTGATFSNSVGGYIFPCTSTLPSMTTYFDGNPITVAGSYMNYAALGNGQCFGGIQSNAGIGFSIYGDIFLKAVFAVFNSTQSTPHLGFAQQS